MKLSLFDTHCDTAYELYHRNVGLDRSNGCHVSLKQTSCYERYAQYFAVWSDRRLGDEACWHAFWQIVEHFQAELNRLSDRIAPVTCAAELNTALQNHKRAAILAVEDARLLNGKKERLDALYACGVRYITLLWGGDTCIGGSHDTQNGLTEFGKAVVRDCFDKGIIPDVSHASEQSADDLISIAYEYGKPFIASHSNAYTVHPHTRNLRDRHFLAIRELGGIVGINLCPFHLTDLSVPSRRNATAENIFSHIDYYLSLGGEDTVGFGADWDGTNLPEGINHAGDLIHVAEQMARRNYSEELIEKLFWKNFYRFSMNHL